MMSSFLCIVFLSSIAPTVIDESAAPTDVTRLLPSFPIAAMGTIPASAQLLTSLAAELFPSSP